MTVCRLDEKKCVPCQGGIPPLTAEEIKPLHEQITGWDVVDNHHLHKVWKFDNYKQAWDFTNQISEIAEAEGHHPVLTLTWGRVEAQIYTHKIDGLNESDFILAAKIDLI